MSKELEAYWKLDHTCCLNSSTLKYGIIDDDPEDRDCKDMSELCDCLDIIENALKELEYLRTEYLGLNQELNIKNKALEIIKEKRVDISMLLGGFYGTLKEYNSCELIYKELTEEEYNLLKEVLL